MICKKCKNEVADNKSVCPHCKTPLKKESKNISVSKGAKNKYISEDSSQLVGGMVSKDKGTFVKLEKKPKKVKEPTPVQRKDYVNYIDYQEAKANFNEKKKKIEDLKKAQSEKIKDINSDIVNTKKVKRSSKVAVKLLKQQSKLKEEEIGTKVIRNYKNKKINKTATKKTTSKLVDIIPKTDTTNGFENIGSVNTTSNQTILTSDNKEFSEAQQLYNYSTSVNNGNATYVAPEVNKRRSFRFEFNFLTYALVISLWVIAIVMLFNSGDGSFYFGEEEKAGEGVTENLNQEMLQYDGVSKSGQVGGASKEGYTSIVYDNQYLGKFTITDLDIVHDLISADSVKQKKNCPANIVKIENEIIDNYGITAVNLCEMDEDFAEELRNVVRYVHKEYPSARNYLTNLTLANVDESASFMAAFMPIFTFSTSNSNTGYPVATKTQIILNAKYFLNPNKIKNSVSYGARSGYFPKNATRSSAVAHEFGHYLSYVALLNYYETDALNFVKASQNNTLYDVYEDFNEGNFSKMLLNIAYEEYLRDTGKNDSFNEFRASISQYAIAKDGNGNYIYDETIAEAFHDCYLNGINAEEASIRIVKVLERYL